MSLKNPYLKDAALSAHISNSQQYIPQHTCKGWMQLYGINFLGPKSIPYRTLWEQASAEKEPGRGTLSA